MVLADPGRVQPDFLGIKRLGENVPEEGLGRARVVGIAVVGEREVAEVHGASSELFCPRMRFPDLFVNANNITWSSDRERSRARHPTRRRPARSCWHHPSWTCPKAS